MDKIKDLLVNKTSEEKQSIKVDELSTIKPSVFNSDGLEVSILSVEKENGLLKIIASATENGEEIFVDNPLYFKNPPIMVPDGTTRTEVIDGREMTIWNYKEDPEEALRQMVAETIRVSKR